jgi:glycine/serine hydroxymethyltransferase
MRRIAELIDTTLQAPEDSNVSERVRAEVRELAGAFPLYPAPVATP